MIVELGDALSSYSLQDQQRMALARNYYEWQARLIRREIGTRVLEAGCGIGNFTEHLFDGEAVVAVDHDPAAIALLEARYRRHTNVRAVTCDIASPDFRTLARFRPDSCVCVNVLEHIEDHRTALVHLASVLPSGGVVVLLVPAFKALFGPLDRNLGHCRRYRRGDMRALASDAGLRVRRMRYMNSAGWFAWWISSRRAALSEPQIRFYDRAVVPVLSRLEVIVPPPFGQSLFSVLEKP